MNNLCLKSDIHHDLHTLCNFVFCNDFVWFFPFIQGLFNVTFYISWIFLLTWDVCDWLFVHWWFCFDHHSWYTVINQHSHEYSNENCYLPFIITIYYDHIYQIYFIIGNVYHTLSILINNFSDSSVSFISVVLFVQLNVSWIIKRDYYLSVSEFLTAFQVIFV